MKVKEIALDGLVRQNPVFKLVLGTCPTLAVSTMALNGFSMGLAVTFVLICSNIIISLLRNIIPDKVRIPAFILIIATFVTLVMLVMDKFLPDLYASLGVFLPLIVVNCLILARAESFASSSTVGASTLDGIFMGLGFTFAITVISIVREFLGKGSLFGIQIMEFQIKAFAEPVGAFIAFGIMIGLFTFVSNLISNKAKNKKAPAVAKEVA